jgi:hypothetical protein
MTVTSSSTLSVIAGTTTTESVGVHVLPLDTDIPGRGRLAHPTFGTLDYPYAPDAWEGFDTDIIIPPVWAYSQTIGGGANTLWAGNIKDVQVREIWNSDISMPMAFVRTLLNLYMNPSAPEDGYVQWSPQYANPHKYNVIMTGVGSNGEVLSLDYITRQGWLAGPLELRMRIVSKVE